MKKIFISLLASACLVACTPKKTAYEQYTELYNDLEAQLETVEDRAVKDSLIEGFITDGYTLIMENVKGMATKIDEIKQDFREYLGNDYKFDYELVRAQDYGVPQKRERLIFIGNRVGIEPNLIFEEIHKQILELVGK